MANILNVLFKNLIALFLIMSNILLFTDNVRGENMSDFEAIENYLNNLSESIPIQNMTLAITNQECTIFSQQYGKGTTIDSSFILGSTSKSFTALAINELETRGAIDLNTSASYYISNPYIPEKIKIIDLLNHTSGISASEKLDNLKFNGDFGTFEYSNANYNILGLVIENITQVDYSTYVEKTIFSPLNMNNSFPLNIDTREKLIQGYKSFFGFPIAVNQLPPKENSWIQAPSGYLCSTQLDTSNYLRYLLEYKKDNTPLIEIIKRDGVFAKDDPAINDLSTSSGIYGYGWIVKNINGKEIIYHTGKTSTFASFFVIIPEDNLGISILYNYSDFLVASNAIEKANEDILRLIMGEKVSCPTANKLSYWLNHVMIDLLLIAIFILALLSFYPLFIVEKTMISTLLTFIPYVIPLTLFLVLKFIDVPPGSLIEFVPDVMLTLISSSVLICLSTILRFFKL